MRRPRIVVAGSLNMDVVCGVQRAPEAGETVLGRHATFSGGGKGANQAIAAARLGGQVTMVGRVGADAFGNTLRSALVADQVDATHVGIDPDSSSGLALILVDDAGQNRITVVPGANAQLGPSHVDTARPVLDGAHLLLLQLETPLPTIARAIDHACAAGVPVMLNPAPAQPLPQEWYARLDYLIPNEGEASLLTGLPVRDDEEAAAAASALFSRGVRSVLVTLGARGVLLFDRQGPRRVPAPVVTAVDTTAAGDTFIGALAVALGEGLSLDQAAMFAVRAASLSVTRRGAQPSIPRRQDLQG